MNKKLLFGIKREIHQLNIEKIPVTSGERKKVSKGDSKKARAFYKYCSEKYQRENRSTNK